MLFFTSKQIIIHHSFLNKYYGTRLESNFYLTLSRRTTYIYMSRCEVFKKPNNIHICCNQCDEVWSNFVHSYYAYCGVLLCCGLLKVRASVCSNSAPPPPFPLNPSNKPIFYMTTHTNCTFIPANMVPDTACLVYGSNRS